MEYVIQTINARGFLTRYVTMFHGIVSQNASCAKLALIVMLCFLTGCAGSASSTRFYLLSALPTPDKPVAMTDTAVEVNILPLPQYLDRPQMVFLSNENRMELAEFDQWGGNLGKNIARTVSQNLMMLLHSPYITTTPQQLGRQPQFQVDMEVVQFERDAQQRVVLDVRWSISDERVSPPLLNTVNSMLRSPPVSEHGDFDATVAAMSRLLGDVSRHIADEIQRRLKSS